MNRKEFVALVQHAGMAVPEGVAPWLIGADPRAGGELLSRGFLADAAARAGLNGQRLAALVKALEVIEGDARLLSLSLALRDDAHAAVIGQRACDFERPEPACLSGFPREAYALLFALACLEQGLKALAARGIPQEDYEAVCRRMADKQLRLYQQTGSAVIADYPWDMNFYACGIFFHDRLYFVPYRWPGPAVYRRHADGNTLMLWPAGSRVRRDGQLDGVNGVKDSQAFTTTWVEDARTLTAHPVNPVGVILPVARTLQKTEWSLALREGELLLAAHIPGGEGYTPGRWKSSMEQAQAFFDRWFPELQTRGFWSESWLYDPSLYRLLPPDGHIMSVQQQFYNFPTMEGEEMARLEVFGDSHQDLANVPVQTSLQRKLRDSLAAGEHYHTTGMIVLREDLPRFGAQPYQTREDLNAYFKLQEGGMAWIAR